MSEGDGDGACFICCRWCSSFLLTSGFTALFLWLSLRPSSPKCYLQNFSIPSLNRSLSNSTINFNLSLVNPNLNKGIYYDPVKVSFFHGSNRSDSLGNFTIPGFYQGHKKKATKGGTIGTSLRGGTAGGFRVEMETRVRYKLIFFKTKRHRIDVGADFEVNGEGNKVSSNDVRLKSSGDRVGGRTTPYYHLANGVLLYLVVVFVSSF
ncbi:Protein NDR1 [Linum perenne]